MFIYLSVTPLNRTNLHVCMYVIQVRSWAWAMYRRSWTAYPAGRLTRTCPTPMRRLPPTARTHEDQHTSPCSPHPPPLCTSSSSTSVIIHHPSSLHSHPPRHHKDAGRKRDVGWKGRGGHTVLPFPLYFTFSPQEEELVLSSPTPFPTSPSPPPPLSSLPGCFAEGEYLSLLHSRLSVTWE